jgi:glycosyltransferase involved in cell wall biosynthesis
MIENMPQGRSVLMLTADRQIDRRILQGADSLEASGWSVTIVAMPLDVAAEDDPRVVRITFSSSRIQRESLVADAYSWVRGLAMNNFAMRLLKRFAWRYLVDQENFYRALFSDAISRYRPSIVVANDLPMLPVASDVAARIGVKLVYDSHELYCEQEFSEREKLRWSAIETKYIGACDAVITVNASIAKELEKRYHIKDVAVIYNAERRSQVCERGWRLHDIFDLSRDIKLLLLQGGLSAGRNIETLIAAFAQVTNPNIHLVVLGDGQIKPHLQKIAERMGIAQRIHFYAAVPQNELLSLTICADAGVIPYQATCLNNFYCTPNKLFEFIAAGLPILASDLPEIRQIVTEGGIGLVAKLNTARDIAMSIDSLFADNTRLEQWRANARVYRNQVCWEREGEKYQAIFERLR